MNRFSFLSFILFLFGIGCFLIAFLEGNVHVGVFFIFPFFIGEGVWSVLGVLLLFLSIVSFMIRPFNKIESRPVFNEYTTNPQNSDEPYRQKKGKFGGIIFIGPIPIIFGQDKKTTAYLLLLGIIIFVVLSVIASFVF